jgi:uncharacterized membrane protein YkvI
MDDYKLLWGIIILGIIVSIITILLLKFDKNLNREKYKNIEKFSNNNVLMTIYIILGILSLIVLGILYKMRSN